MWSKIFLDSSSSPVYLMTYSHMLWWKKNLNTFNCTL